MVLLLSRCSWWQSWGRMFRCIMRQWAKWTTIGSSCLRRRPESDWIGQSLRTMPCGRYKDYYLDTVQVGLAPTTGESMWEPPVSRTGMNMLELMVTYADLLAFWFSFFLKHMRRESHETWTFYKHLQAWKMWKAYHSSYEMHHWCPGTAPSLDQCFREVEQQTYEACN